MAQSGDKAGWRSGDVERWSSYDDDLSGLEEFCQQKLHQKENDDEALELTGAARAQKLASITLNEKQAAVAYKMLLAACQGKLRDLTVEPRWVLQTPTLVSNQ